MFLSRGFAHLFISSSRQDASLQPEHRVGNTNP
jgi:hypothetical protein